jgi:hypothetical protein
MKTVPHSIMFHCHVQSIDAVVLKLRVVKLCLDQQNSAFAILLYFYIYKNTLVS